MISRSQIDYRLELYPPSETAARGRNEASLSRRWPGGLGSGLVFLSVEQGCNNFQKD